MKFRVSRTSGLFGRSVPCEGAYLVSTPENPYSRHVWGINMDTIEDLIAFADRYGPLVLTGDQIEIYDTFRE